MPNFIHILPGILNSYIVDVNAGGWYAFPEFSPYLNSDPAEIIDRIERVNSESGFSDKAIGASNPGYVNINASSSITKIVLNNDWDNPVARTELPGGFVFTSLGVLVRIRSTLPKYIKVYANGFLVYENEFSISDFEEWGNAAVIIWNSFNIFNEGKSISAGFPLNFAIEMDHYEGQVLNGIFNNPEIAVDCLSAYGTYEILNMQPWYWDIDGETIIEPDSEDLEIIADLEIDFPFLFDFHQLYLLDWREHPRPPVIGERDIRSGGIGWGPDKEYPENTVEFPPIFTGDYPGIYAIEPGKTNDTVYISLEPEETEDIKIPDPMIRTFLHGDSE